MRTRFLVVALIGLSLGVGVRYAVYACGRFFEMPVFTHPSHPDHPMKSYFGGELGLLQPTYWRIYLLTAWRSLSGAPLTPAEQQILVDEREGGRNDPQPSELERWLQARSQVPGAAAAGSFAVYRDGPEYSSYLNCTESAFATAVATLHQLRASGAPAEEVSRWLAAQDQVFLNCPGGTNIPDPPDESFSARARDHREYQIAAAHFYAGDFAEARRRFETITTDADSPWSRIAPYLVARTLVREATLSVPTWRGFDPELMERARVRLESILATAGLAECHPAARDLLSYVRIRLEPETVLEELAGRLSRPESDLERFEQDVLDFLALLDRGTTTDHPMVRWIRAFQQGSVEELTAAWQENRSPQTLLALATRLPPGHDAVAQVLAETGDRTAESAAGLSFLFHRARLLIREDAAGARALADGVLERERLPPSTRNAFLALRMLLARSIQDLAADLPRRPGWTGWLYGDPGEQLVEEGGYVMTERAFLDADGAVTLTRHLSLETAGRLLEHTGQWPDRLRLELLRALWVKAALLEEWPALRRLTGRLSEADQALAPALAVFEGDLAVEDLRFESALVMLRHPGLHPYLPAGILRADPVGELNNFRDNWWCSLAPDAAPTTYNHYVMRTSVSSSLLQLHGDEISPPAFLNPADQQQAREEWGRLSRLPTGPNLLAARVLQQAEARPSDPQLAEALHLAVRATRFGCTDDDTGTWSRRAFQALHQRFPDTEWAKKTPYWFR